VAGYASSARLEGAIPRFAGANQRHSTMRPEIERLSSGELPADVDQLELVGRPIDEGIADRLASAGAAWSQLTFFLFDPESWR
jgi:hypothetical protein